MDAALAAVVFVPGLAIGSFLNVVAARVPIKRSMDVPINTEVRIKQNITLPIDTALGKFDLPVPIDATVPINTTVPIAFDQTINISTTVPIRLNVPVRVDLGSKQLAPYLDQLRQRLLELRDSL